MSAGNTKAAGYETPYEFHCATIDLKRPDQIEFEDIIAPLTPETFFSEYWEQKPVVTRGRPATFFAPLFSIRDVDRAISFLRPKPSRIEVVTEHGFVRDNFLNPDGTANLNLVRDRYLEGSTVILAGLGETWEPMAPFSCALEKRLSHSVGIAIYLTPPKFHGVNPHFDTQEVFVLQVEGRKKWKVYKPVNELPLVEDSYRLVPRERLAEPICDTELQPGDVLYIPRGFVHEAEADDAPSLHIALDIHVRTWNEFLADALSAMTEKHQKLRRSLPVGFLNDATAMQSVSDQFEELMDFFHREATAEDAVRKHIEKFAVRKPAPPDGQFAALNAEVGPQTVLRKRRTSLARVFESEGVAGIQFSGNQLVGPAKIAPALRHIAAAEIVKADELPGSLSENEKILLLKKLVRTGLLTTA